MSEVLGKNCEGKNAIWWKSQELLTIRTFIKIDVNVYEVHLNYEQYHIHV